MSRNRAASECAGDAMRRKHMCRRPVRSAPPRPACPAWVRAARERVEKGCLAGAVRSDHADQFALAHFEIARRPQSDRRSEPIPRAQRAGRQPRAALRCHREAMPPGRYSTSRISSTRAHQEQVRKLQPQELGERLNTTRNQRGRRGSAIRRPSRSVRSGADERMNTEAARFGQRTAIAAPSERRRTPERTNERFGTTRIDAGVAARSSSAPIPRAPARSGARTAREVVPPRARSRARSGTRSRLGRLTRPATVCA